jgi:hypothetical protein
MFSLFKKRKSTIPLIITIVNKRKEALNISESETNGVKHINITLKPGAMV